MARAAAKTDKPKAAPRAKKEAPAETVVAFKGFDKDLKCRGYQFEVGETYDHTGEVVACESGFHACENPFDVWGYYGVGEGNRFARVTLSGELARHNDDSKIAAGRITVDAELRLPDFIAAAVKWVIYATSGNGDDPSGASAKIGSSGGSAQIGSSGAAAKIGSSGYYAQIGSSGDYAKIDASGANAVIACAGAGAAVKAGEGGAICIPWHDGDRTRFAVGYVGEDGIEAGVRYIARDGKLVAAQS